MQRVGSLTWNSLLLASIFEGWLNCFIDWNQWITTLEAWSSCLWNTLRTRAGYASSCWCYLSHCWGIGRSDLCSILIYRLTVTGSGVPTYCFSGVKVIEPSGLMLYSPTPGTVFVGLSIFESHWFRIINWNQWITFCEGWGTFWRLTLIPFEVASVEVGVTFHSPFGT